MAVTTQASTPARRGAITNSSSADLRSAEVIRAAPGAGLSVYLRHITISVDTAMAVTIGAGKTGSAVTTVIAGPFHVAASSTINVPFPEPVKLAANTELVADSDTAGNFTVVSSIYEAP
jgi:hypothetical protein